MRLLLTGAALLVVTTRYRRPRELPLPWSVARVCPLAGVLGTVSDAPEVLSRLCRNRLFFFYDRSNET